MISLLLPTRKRPELCHRFLQSVVDTANDIKNVEVIIYADEDDIGSHHINHGSLTVKVIIGLRQTMGAYNMDCLEKSQGDIIVLVNDDMVIRTQGWDDRLQELDRSVKDKVYLAYGNDLFKKGDLCTFPILSRKTCEILQQPYHKAYRGAFIDYHLMDIFKRLQKAGHDRVFYLEDVVFEHLHYRTGKSEVDETYLARGRFDDDMLFIGLADVRRISFENILRALNQQSDSLELPVFTESAKPGNLISALIVFSKVFLADTQLPIKWRIFLFWWFNARYVASFLIK